MTELDVEAIERAVRSVAGRSLPADMVKAIGVSVVAVVRGDAAPLCSTERLLAEHDRRGAGTHTVRDVAKVFGGRDLRARQRFERRLRRALEAREKPRTRPRS